MKKFKVGLQLYSVRDAMGQDFEETLQKVKDMGYDYVEFAGFFEKSADEVKAILDKIGLTAISVHQGHQLFEEQGMKLIEYLKTIDIKFCAIPWHNINNWLENWDGTIKSFTEFSKALKTAGIKLCYHNHDFELTNDIDGVHVLDKLYNTLSTDVIDPEFDTCWVHYAGENPAEYIEKYAGRVEIVHLKDFVCTKLADGPVYHLIDKNGKAEKAGSKEETGFKFVPLGMGRQDFPAILKACEEAGTEYVIVEQDQSPDRDPLEAAKISREYLKTLGL